jgi:hypothetical protein
MATQSQTIAGLLQHLRDGTWDQNDLDLLERTQGAEIVDELSSAYPVKFQERSLGSKREVSLARSVRNEVVSRRIVGAAFVVSLQVVPVYVDCLMLSIEDGFITGISRFARLRVRPVRKPVPGLALTMSRGFKLDLSPDGWAMKPLVKRTTRLPESLLMSRGWQFQHLAQFVPAP